VQVGDAIVGDRVELAIRSAAGLFAHYLD
jgi:hypothetical protein